MTKLKLTEERKGQIALIIFKKQLARKQITLSRRKFLQEMNDGAMQVKNDGITKAELISIYEDFVREAVEEMFKPEKKQKKVEILPSKNHDANKDGHQMQNF